MGTSSGTRGSRSAVIAGVAVGVVLVLAISPPVSERLGYTPPLGIGNVLGGDKRGGELRLKLLPGTQGLTIRDHPLYPADDPWIPWLADDQTCPRGEDSGAPAKVQVQVFLCLANFARARQGLQPLVYSRLLSASAAVKATDIIRCNDFEHDACGLAPERAAVGFGYRGPFGENLYVAEPPLVAPRVALDRWLNSPGHRENLFRPEWRTIGIALLGGDLSDYQDAVVWVNHFGV